jgi:hypothetical protein
VIPKISKYISNGLVSLELLRFLFFLEVKAPEAGSGGAGTLPADCSLLIFSNHLLKIRYSCINCKKNKSVFIIRPVYLH